MNKKNISYPFCLSIDRNGFAYCSTHNHCSGLFFMDELLCMKDAIEKTILAYKKEGITDSYVEDEDKKAMEIEFSRIHRRKNDARGEIVDDLYLIQDTCTNLLKIGRSKNAESRKKTMQTATGNRLELLFVIKGYGYKELELHDKFAKYRKQGEWFEYDKTIIDEFVSLEKEDKSSSKKDDMHEFVEKIYKMYPSYCPMRETSLGKCSKDKDRIVKLLKKHTMEEIEAVVMHEVEEKYGKHYMANFSTFLNNFPDPQIILGENKTNEMPKSEELVINGQKYK